MKIGRILLAVLAGLAVQMTYAKETLHQAVTDTAKCRMLNSLETLEEGRLYVMDYTVDYRLDDMLAAAPGNLGELFPVMQKLLFDVQSSASAQRAGFGCSVYAATEAPTGNYLMGRNYDFVHAVGGKEEATAAIVVRTSPKNGYKSVSLVDPYFLGLKSDFYTNEQTDISALMCAPYDIFDGMNERGLAVCDLFLDGHYASQSENGRKNIFATVAMRAILDKCADIDEAIAFLKKYNMQMQGAVPNGSLHFYLADATGHYAIIEYTFSDPEKVDENTVPDVFKVMRDEDAYRYMTNFYVDPDLSNCAYGGLSQHGRDRYNVLKATVEAYKNQLTTVRAKALLQSVSQSSNPSDPTSHTQWSSLYNLTEKTLDLAILQEYEHWYHFSLAK